MIEQVDRELFFFLNGLHCEWLDQPMFWISKSLVWIPFYAILLYYVIRHYRRETLWILVFVILMITASDQIANVFKDTFQRLRPSNNPLLTGVHIVNGYKGGLFGFYSSHASNTFALAVFLTMVLARFYRYFPILIFTWALLLSYSRIYLGVHYPGDILAGILAGSLLGLLSGYLYRRLNDMLSLRDK
jgi:undecaprenyl-diphosphatase